MKLINKLLLGMGGALLLCHSAAFALDIIQQSSRHVTEESPSREVVIDKPTLKHMVNIHQVDSGKHVVVAPPEKQVVEVPPSDRQVVVMPPESGKQVIDVPPSNRVVIAKEHHHSHHHQGFFDAGVVIETPAVVAEPPVIVERPVFWSGGGRFGSWTQWRYLEERIPGNAIIGGHEPGRPLYVCQARYNGSVHPGKLVEGRCNITYAGQEISLDNFRVLVGRGVYWVWARGGYVPANAIQGGYENGQPLFICRAPFMRGVHPGKIVANACNIGYAGQEYARPMYQVLVGR